MAVLCTSIEIHNDFLAKIVYAFFCSVDLCIESATYTNTSSLYFAPSGIMDDLRHISGLSIDE
jgi:hypothetical protein